VIEILKSLELAATRFAPPVLITPGIVLVVLGLFIWLDGLRRRRISMVLAAAIVGAVLVFVMGLHSTAIAVLPIFVAVAVAALLPRLLMAALLAKLVAGIVFLVLAWGFITDSNAAGASPPRKVDASSNLPFSVKETVDLARAYGMDLTDNIKQTGTKLPSNRWIIVGSVGLGLFVFGLIFRDVAGAIVCSLFGTLLVWAGLVILLMYKGSRPVQWIEHNAPVCGLAAFAMIAFAGLEQYLLWRKAEHRRMSRQPKTRREYSDEAPGWRGH
jgi:hypothetical protein